MSGSEGTSELSLPVQYGQRRVIPRNQGAGQTGRKSRQPRPMVGGDVVGSMKGGIKDRSGDLRRRESRLLVLCKSPASITVQLRMVGDKMLISTRFNRWRLILLAYCYLAQEALYALELLVRSMRRDCISRSYGRLFDWNALDIFIPDEVTNRASNPNILLDDRHRRTV